jgi:hypothetical protein
LASFGRKIRNRRPAGYIDRILRRNARAAPPCVNPRAARERHPLAAVFETLGEFGEARVAQ